MPSFSSFLRGMVAPRDSPTRRRVKKLHPSENYPGFLTYQIGPPCIFVDEPDRLHVGSNVILNDAFIDLRAEIWIGDDTFFGHGVKLLTGGHDVHARGVARQKAITARPIRIGEGVWIASHVIVLPGAEIGDHAVVGAGSVVHGKIPANVIAAGNPARVVRSLDG